MKYLADILEWMGPRGKAVAAAAVAFLLGLQRAKSGGISFDEWVDIALATLAGAGVTYAVPNRPAEPPRAVRTPKAPPA